VPDVIYDNAVLSVTCKYASLIITFAGRFGKPNLRIFLKLMPFCTRKYCEEGITLRGALLIETELGNLNTTVSKEVLFVLLT
jgi:hypothetical protein